MLRCESLSKSYGARVVFDNLSLHLDPGVYALQGANGSGKSTLLSILAGARPADAGEVWIGGESLVKEPIRARRRLSYAPDESPIYPFMTGRDLLAFVAAAKRTKMSLHVADLIQALRLNAVLDTRFSMMSFGTQKKFLLVAAWIGEPQVLLLDEPSNGLDIDARVYLAGLFRGFGKQMTILFSTHDADFISQAGGRTIAMNQLCPVQL
jgi:heme-transporting ATPase